MMNWFLCAILLLRSSRAVATVDGIALSKRHDAPPEDKKAHFNFPIASSSSSHFLSSSSDITICAPELDGYFGGGTGDAPLAQLHVVQAERQRLLDTLLPATFPQICKNDATDSRVVRLVRPLLGRVTGYHFGKTEQWCNNENTTDCSIVTTVSIYGHDLQWSDCVTLLDTVTHFIPEAHRYASRIDHADTLHRSYYASTYMNIILVIMTVVMVIAAVVIMFMWYTSSSSATTSSTAIKRMRDDRTVRTHLTSIYLHGDDDDELEDTERESLDPLDPRRLVVKSHSSRRSTKSSHNMRW